MIEQQPEPALGEAEDRRAIRRPRRMLVAAIIFFVAATVVAVGQRSDDGPLAFPDGFEFMHYWSAGGVFTVLEACGANGPVEVEIVDVVAVTMPEATTRDVFADGFEVTYLVGHTKYVEVADGRFGACATDPRPAPSPRCKGRKGVPPA